MPVTSKTLGPAAALGVFATAVALAAPPAGATVAGVDLSPGLSFGSASSYGVGCEYKVTVTAAPNTSVALMDENTDNNERTGYWLPFSPINVVTDGTGKGTTTWYPSWKGLHTFTAREFGSDAVFTTTVTAGTATKVGPACLVS